MSAPLTIDELKSLEIGDWVWVETFDKHFYYKILVPSVDEMVFSYRHYTDVMKYSDYGKTWLAYKNKEQAECNGEIVELPCILKSHSTYPKNQVVYINEFGSIIVERFSYEQDAERRLAELKGEE